MNLIKQKILSRANSDLTNWLYFAVGYTFIFRTIVNDGGYVYFQVVKNDENEKIIESIYNNMEEYYKYECFNTETLEIYKKRVYWHFAHPKHFNKRIKTIKTCKLKRKELSYA